MGESGGGEEGGIGLSASKVEGAGDPEDMGVVGAQSIDTVWQSPVQGTIVEKREGRMAEVWIARSASSAKINLIGGSRTEMGPLARMMVSYD